MKKILSVVLILAMMIPFLSVAPAALVDRGASVEWGNVRVNAYYADGKANPTDGVVDTTMAIDTRFAATATWSAHAHLGATWQGGESPYLSLGVLSKMSAANGGTGYKHKITNVKVEMAQGGFEIRWEGEEPKMYQLPGEALFSGKGGWFSVGTDGNFVEMRIPLYIATIYEEDGAQMADLKVTVSLENGSTETFGGAVVFKDTMVEYSNTLAGENKTDRIGFPTGTYDWQKFTSRGWNSSTTTKLDYEADGIWLQPYSRAANTTKGKNIFGSITTIDNSPIYEAGKKGSLSFDFFFDSPNVQTVSVPVDSEVTDTVTAANPLNTTKNGTRSLIYIGIGEGGVSTENASYRLAQAMLVFSIYEGNTAKDLYLAYDDGKGEVEGVGYGERTGIPLGKSSNVFFKLGFEWTPVTDGYKVDIFVDGKYVGFLNVPAEKKIIFPINFGNGVAFGVAVDETANATNSTSTVWYRNFNITTKNSDKAAEIDTSLASLLDYNVIAPVEFQEKTEGETRSLRFLTKIQDLTYKKVGFEIVVTDKDLGKISNTVVHTSSKAYTSVIADGQSVPAGEGNYYVGAVVTDIPKNKNYIFTVKFFVVTGEGDTVYRKIGVVELFDDQPKVLMVENDVDPITGAGQFANTDYVADKVHNSIVYDMGAQVPINHAVLNSTNANNRLSKNFVALYYSNDNVSYTAIPEFTMLNAGNEVYFYNFSVTARYLKAHFTYEDEPAAELAISNSLQDLMSAYSTDALLLSGGGSFEKQTTVAVSNATGEAVYDRVECFTLEQLGISKADLKEDLSDLRFCYNGKQLPHMIVGDKIYVRMLVLPAGGATVMIYYGNEQAGSVANGSETFEIEYGNKLATTLQGGNWITTVEQMPDGSLIIIGSFSNLNKLGIMRSTDGGRTWSSVEEMQFAADTTYIPEEHKVNDSGGFIVDREKGIAYFLCVHNIYDPVLNPDRDSNLVTERTFQLLITKDNGKTWSIQDLPIEGYYGGTYSDGLKLSCYDGAGPNVDYVFTLALKKDGVRYLSSVYSADDGATWTLSNSLVSVAVESNPTLAAEAGLSEETVWEQEDGTLIMYARYQVSGKKHFAVVRSTDHGVTWGAVEESQIYASNTQPVIIGNNGVPVILWGGNNSHGADTYSRLPLNIAYSLNGAETFTGILDISHQTILMNRDYVSGAIAPNQASPYAITNPDIVIYERGGVDCAYIYAHNFSIHIENFSDYLYKTKGAFDSFESGDYTAEGWIAVDDNYTDDVEAPKPTVTTSGVTDGRYALQIGSYNKLSRSLHYAEKGMISFDWYVENMGEGFTFELQSAYNSATEQTAPITLYVDASGAISYVAANGTRQATGLSLATGANHISISFDGNAGTASLAVNGQSSEIVFRSNVGNYICFAYIYTQSGTRAYMDSFVLWDQD